MASTTGSQLIPYPQPADGNNVPADMQALAERVDLLLDALDVAVAANTDASVPAGTVRATLKATADTGWVLGNQTIVGCDSTYPALWAAAPAAMKSGSDLAIPDLSDLSPIGAGSFAALGVAAGSNTQSLTEAHLASHDHTMPNHNHTISHTHGHDLNVTAGSADHTHTYSNTTSYGGGHGHSIGNGTTIATGAAGGSAVPTGSGGFTSYYWAFTSSSTSAAAGYHAHSVSGTTSGPSNTDAYHGHGLTGGVSSQSGTVSGTKTGYSTNNAGSGTAHNIVSASFGVTYQIKAH